MMVSDMWMVDARQLTVASTGHCIVGVDAHTCDTTFDISLLKLVHQSCTLVVPHFKQHLATEVSGEVIVSIQNAGKLFVGWGSALGLSLIHISEPTRPY